MPILPPRNLPFSPGAASSSAKGSPHTPPAVRDRPTAGSPSSHVTTPSKAARPIDAGVVPRQEETTFHRRLRTILWDYRSAFEKWEDIVSLQGAKSVASLARLSAALDDILAKRVERKEDAIHQILYLEDAEIEARRLDEMAILLKGLEAERETLAEVMIKVDKATARLANLGEAAEALLVEATRSRGSDFTFEKEMWVTWSMNRFGE
jgi:hypothetical protein